MPPLYDLKQEKFAQCLAVGDKTIDECYQEAGYKSNAGNSSRCRNYPHVAKRVDELREKAAKKVGVDIQRVVEMLLEDRERAHKADQISAAIRAAELLGKYLGMFVEKKEVKTGTLEDVDLGTLEHFRQRLVSAATRNALEGDREGTTRPEDRDVLPGGGTSTEVALSEASELLRGGGNASSSTDLP